MQNISMSDAELLKYAIENGMIDPALVQERIEMHKREELLKKHPYKIYQGTDGNPSQCHLLPHFLQVLRTARTAHGIRLHGQE